MNASARRNFARVQHELAAAINVPYTTHVSEHVIKTRHGHYVLVCRLSGASFESADDEQLNNWYERLNVLWRNLASPNPRPEVDRQVFFRISELK
jgi:type IV secretion system protein VirB4